MIYLDNSATTAPKEEVLNSFVEVNKRFFANPASLHVAGREAETLLEKSREQILNLTQVSVGTVIYTSGGTEANNLAVIGFARKYQNRGNHILTTKIEHPSVLEAVKQLEREGFIVEYLSVNKDGVISIDELKEKLREDTVVVSIMHVNNEIGAIQPIEDCGKVIRKKSRAIFHVDAVQSFGKLPLILSGNGPDAITISGHKIHGLKGSGALITKKLVNPSSINYGGGQEQGLRNGTVSVPNAVALARAVRLATENRKTVIFERWRQRLIEHIEQSSDVLVLAKETAAPHILSIAFAHIKGEVAINYFQKNGILVSTSSACSSKSEEVSHVIEAIQLEDKYKHGVIRVSFAENNTNDEVVRFEKVFTNFVNLLKRGRSHDVE
ncbi:cysteine desulfurase family protein [Sporosarcina pasteurii]|uniref:Cysteine desulfurase n=1 Tax=Sporosarcina pasteurii TaxID=1474 RepID=A0A380C5K0_SPOPA|nr:cysteine desulfurase family protein [Sporosarcina pasteurii]MDS9471761.1 cysteine desulfurase family protein [Sporosarcina pasteurii]QBQ04642.1 cysteine desulfurase [Sporosarcina pasteurii]SUJ13200.1 Cysteine desulfurase [Sporosarcina pasteurii]